MTHCEICDCLTGGGRFCFEHAPYTVSPQKDGIYLVDRNGQRSRVSYEPPAHLVKLRCTCGSPEAAYDPHEPSCPLYEVETVKENDPISLMKPEALKAACLDCGLPYADFPLDLVLPRSQWLEIHPAEHGLLCAACIVKRASKVPGCTVVHAILEISPEAPQAVVAVDPQAGSTTG